MAEPDYSNAGVAAAAAGMPVIDPTQHKVKYGGDEINVTRDLLALRTQYGPTVPGTAGHTEGEMFFKV